MAETAIVRGGQHLAAERNKACGQRGEFLGRTRPQEDQGRPVPTGQLAQPAGEKEQRRDAHATTDQADRPIGLQAEPPAERAEQTQTLPGARSGEQMGAPADNLEEDLHLTVPVHLVHREGAPQQRVQVRSAGDHDKLSGPGGSGDAGGVQGEAENPLGQLLGTENVGFFLELDHGRRYKREKRLGLMTIPSTIHAKWNHC